MKRITLALIAVLLSTQLYPTSTNLPETPPEPLGEVLVEKVEEVPTEKEKPVEKPQKALIDPNGCEPEQFWAKEPPHECIEKPKAQPVKQVNYPVDCEAYRHLIAKYSWDVETMMYAMRHESGCNPNAVGDNYTINGVYAPSCGLLQIRTLAGRPTCDQLKDPATNISTAFAIWRGQGYRAWTVLH